MIRKLPTKDQHTGCPRCNYMGCCWFRERHGETLGHWYWYVSYHYGKLKSFLSPKRLLRWLTALDYSRIEDIEVDGIDTRDYPDFCDAFVASATYKGREMTDAELERLNEDSDFVYECVQERLY